LPRKQSITLTEAELRLMNVLWEKGPSTVHQIQQSLDGSELAYNSVLTTIRILEKKGYVKHAKDGRAHVYETTIGKQDATRFEIRNLVSRFFRDSHEALVLNILEDETLDQKEIQRLMELISRRKA
jgi:predicted transcriptional regulator